MKKKYTKPEIDVILIKSQGILTDSSTDTDDGDEDNFDNR